jgi:hypothetical protein
MGGSNRSQSPEGCPPPAETLKSFFTTRSTPAYTMPLRSFQPDVRAGLAQLIADSAGQGVVAVRAVRAEVANTFVLPWHGSMKHAKDNDERYLDAWAAYLETVTRDGRATPGPPTG